jgi:non-ribosomal peptide synthetase component E (peptide arylation enzyme)
MLLQDLLREAAARPPAKVAIVSGSRRLTFSYLESASNRLAAALAAHGVRTGDRVGMCLAN